MSEVSESPSLRRVAKGDLCAGCGACAGLAPGKISMQVAPPGYLRPHQTNALTDTEERAIAAICPGLGQDVQAEGRTDDVLWGPYRRMQIGWATDPTVRFAGSSGGGLTAMLRHLVAAGHVDAVLTNGADPDMPIGNVPVVTADMDALTRAAGSRYAPSAPLQDLAGLRASGQRYAFLGKPCDVAALRALLRHDPSYTETFPVLLSFFCAGVPSHTGGRAVLAALGTTLEDTATFRFRGNGWPGRATAVSKDGSEASMSYHDSWGKILSKHVQNRCKICADGTGTAADIVCADAWESDADGYPVFDEADGISLIVARTDLGAKLIAEAQDQGVLETDDFDVSTLADIQPGQRERRRALLARLLGRRLMGLPIPRYQGLHLRKAARQNPLARNLKNFLGMVRRAAKARFGGRA